MKLYAFYPIENEQGADFAVIAESEEQARQLVTEYIATHFADNDSAVDGWPETYRDKVCEVGQVISNWGIG